MLEFDSELELMKSLRERISRHADCRGYGYVMQDGHKVQCSCRREALYQYRVAQSGIPPRFRTMGFKDYAYKDSDAYRKVMDYLSHADEHRRNGVGLFLHGPSYTGKSLLACSTLMELMRRGHDCQFLYFDGMLDSGDVPITRLANTVDFLCLERVFDVINNLTNFKDAVLTGNRIHGVVEMLNALLSRRAHAGRPVIITSPVSIVELNARFPSIASTVAGSCVYVECEDKGFRQRRIEQMMDPD